MDKQRIKKLLDHARKSLATWEATPPNLRADAPPYNLIPCEEVIDLLEMALKPPAADYVYNQLMDFLGTTPFQVDYLNLQERVLSLLVPPTFNNPELIKLRELCTNLVVTFQRADVSIEFLLNWDMTAVSATITFTFKRGYDLACLNNLLDERHTH